MASDQVVRELIDSGVHFGHRVSRWNPKMAAYIYGKRNQIHIVDIRETLKGLLRGQKFLAKVVAGGQDILFVGTKRQAKHLILDCANRVGMPYVAERWLGGTLTNFRTIRSRLTRLEELERLEADGSLENYSKKMKATLLREKLKMKRNLEGIRKMNRLPGALVVVDVRREHIAVKEARKLKIPTVCLTDTDSDPDYADIVIPGNDDAIRSIDTILGKLVEAIEAGMRARPESVAEEEQPEQAGMRRPRRRRTTTAMAEAVAGGGGRGEETVATSSVAGSAGREEAAAPGSAGGVPGGSTDTAGPPEIKADARNAYVPEAAPSTEQAGG